MQEEATTESAEPCPTCGRPMEPVYFSAGLGFLLVRHGQPPKGLLAQLRAVFTQSPVCTESGMPVLAGGEQSSFYPAMHCKQCRQIILRYSG
jgi:endogenous inhibitor of DNA gyrase (YacG/DUF329 family)